MAALYGGIVVAAQRSFNLTELILALDRLPSTTEDSDWIGLVRWLNDWRER